MAIINTFLPKCSDDLFLLAQSSQPFVIDLTEDSDREDTDDEESVNVTR